MRSAGPFVALVTLGALWGFTIPMTRIAVSTGHPPLGLIFWQLVIMLPVLGLVTRLRGRRPDFNLRHWGLFLVVALSGTVLPSTFSYRAAAELPAGVMAIIIAIVPMFALPVAILMRLERPQLVRFAGVLAGAAAVAMIVGPETSLPAGTPVIFVFVALVAPACYGIEGNYISWRGISGLDPVEVIFGASVMGLVLVAPICVATGTFINPFLAWGAPEQALVISAISNSLAYSGYVWLIGRAGSVYAAQVAYLVTAFGVLWSMLLLGERYSPWIWAAFVLMMLGIALVRPRQGRQAGTPRFD